MDVILDILSYNILSFENIENINYTFSGKIIEKYANVKEAGFFGISKKIKSNEEIVKRTAEIKKKFNGVNIDMTARTTTTTYNPDVSVIVIDPGHGGSDTGAVGTYLGSTYYEKYFNMDIAFSVMNELQYYGYTVYMTRTSDANVSLTSRYTLANNVGADAFISIHCNSNDNTNARGTTCIYPNNHDIDRSQDMALWVHSFTTYAFPAFGIPYKDNRDLAVLRGTTMPAIITETGFMSNQTDMSILTNSSSRTSIGYYIALGVRDWDLFGEY
jgi:N-acetylmuramoyl-L-alanine amidase